MKRSIILNSLNPTIYFNLVNQIIQISCIYFPLYIGNLNFTSILRKGHLACSFGDVVGVCLGVEGGVEGGEEGS